MVHIKKTEMPTSWPVPRKGKRKRFVAVPSHSTSKGISLLFLLRDVLKLVKTRKEARYMTLNGMVRVNNILRKDENFPVQVFDTLNLSIQNVGNKEQGIGNRNYRLEIVNRKFSLKDVSEKEAGEKIVKIIGKKILDGAKVQMNLDDGQNVLSKEKFSVGDSVVLRTVVGSRKSEVGSKTGSVSVTVERILPLKEGAKVEIILGKHAGEKGELVGFEDLVRGRSYKIKLKDKIVSLPFKTVLVIG
ncbi:MAG: hypothetical protein KJ592_02065 [Nanoarchaeota archaeon]|nr:hypothetical protein [Nanoarchaeota archaeon]